MKDQLFSNEDIIEAAKSGIYLGNLQIPKI